MRLQFTDARVNEERDGPWLCLLVTERTPARGFLDGFEPGKLYDVEVKRHRKRRSLDANAYFWELAGKLSAGLHISSEEVYRQYIPFVGDNFKMIPVRERDLGHWESIWCGGHIGRSVADRGPCANLPGYHNVESYYGSSDYDTAQMSRLIDLVVRDCQEQGIETLPPRELERLKEQWGGRGK